MLTRIKTASLTGVTGYPVVVETDIHRGMPAFNLAGLADATIRESFRRIKPAVINSGYQFPDEKITVNLMPAGKQKEGSHFDLPIALGIILSKMECPSPEDTGFLGEISLDGRINHIRGALPLAMCLRNVGIHNIVLPMANADEVSVLEDINIIPVETIGDAVTYILNPHVLDVYERREFPTAGGDNLDFSQVVGQESVKRAIVVAVSGMHGVLLMGGPGCGKTMMARRIPSIMPQLTYEEQLEITGIYSVAGLLGQDCQIINQRPFRSPHSTISAIGLTGGGSGRIRPGELSLAHGGVLFLDELGEFDNRAIDAMRQPLEEGVVRINRNTEEIVFPSRTMVVVASNPCKCGYLWDRHRVCTCTPQQLSAHQKKLAGPFADRIDMHIKVNPVSRESIEESSLHEGETSESMRLQVERCLAIQKERYRHTAYTSNGTLDEKGIERYCRLDSEGMRLVTDAYESMHMTMRAYSKVIKIARTIADLDGAAHIGADHIAEALMYRIKG